MEGTEMSDELGDAIANLFIFALMMSALFGPFIVQMRIERKREEMLRKHYADRQQKEPTQ
jgi:hypothetical protein